MKAFIKAGQKNQLCVLLLHEPFGFVQRQRETSTMSTTAAMGILK